MINARFLRPFARAAFRAPAVARPAIARPALVAQQNKKTEVGAQQMVRLPLLCSVLSVAVC
jgi:F-type H+-transporting ATPase subunit 8